MRNYICLIAMLCFFSGSTALAVEGLPAFMTENKQEKGEKETPNHFFSTMVYSLNAGMAWHGKKNKQTIELQAGVERAYVSDESSDSLISGELFVGIQKDILNNWHMQLGLALGTKTGAEVNGDIWDDADETFNNFSYTYKVQQTSIAVKALLLKPMDYSLFPFVAVNLGVGFNRATDFSSKATVDGAVPQSPFKEDSTTALTYAVSVGLQKTVHEHMRLGLGYEFAELGESRLAKSKGQTLGDGLKLDSMQTHGFLLSFSYVN